jgi:hypothetical protein
MWARIGAVALMTFFPLLAWGVAYQTTRESISLTDQGITYKAGGFFGSTRSVRFADCARFEFQIHQVPGRGGRRAEAVTPYFIFRDGTSEEIGAFILRGEALDDLLERLRRRGIPVVGDRRGL